MLKVTETDPLALLFVGAGFFICTESGSFKFSSVTLALLISESVLLSFML